MTLIIHDMDELELNKTIFANIENSKIIKVNNIKPCIGCFNCWLKHPGICSLNDNYILNGYKLSKYNKLIVISKNYYGMFSPNIKAFFDRSIAYVKPQFQIIDGKMHHQKRYMNTLNIDYYFYGDINDHEKDTLNKLVIANGKNLHSNNTIKFISSWEDYYV